MDPSRLGGNAAHIILIGIHAHHATLRYPCEIATIRDVMTMAAEGDDPWILSAGTIDISFAIIQIDASTGATLSAPTTPLANAGASPPPFPDHLDVCSKQIPESVDVAITDRAEKRAASSSVLGCPPRNLGHPSSM